MTTRPTPSSRPSESFTPKPPLKLHSLAIIADRAQLTGTFPITIGENTVIHPHARLNASTAPITIGKNCSISEKALIATVDSSEECVIGDGVSVEGDAVVEGASIGDWSVIEVGARIGRMAQVGRYCKVGALQTVLPGERVGDFTVVFGENQRRVDKLMMDEGVRGQREKGQVMYVELLRKLGLEGNKWRT